MLTQAHQRVEDILSEPSAYNAPPDAVQRIKDYVVDCAKAQKVAPLEWTQ